MFVMKGQNAKPRGTIPDPRGTVSKFYGSTIPNPKSGPNKF